MTSHRRYQFTFQADRLHHEIQQLVADRLSEPDWIQDPWVNDSGAVVVQFTVIGRDQWFCHKRAMAVAESLAWFLDEPIPVPLWDVLPPHTNRGYARYRR